MHDLAEVIGGARERLLCPLREEERGTLLGVAPEKVGPPEGHLLGPELGGSLFGETRGSWGVS
ncbi:hypothetical protein SAMD00023353_0104770 [Rosellinia necatrix]|uniref:Uncharacterized protein n=1 Tax=Rosellinia necatrix TaxID=77044 RepID=A0A1S8A549_ROSNE|nr:hypothetical protein SAMD00023353_0104770 [Rosellinia necatrix]